MSEPVRHACPCCGYKTLTEPTPGSYAICSVCCWQDVEPGAEAWSESVDGTPLAEAQRLFDEIGACDPQWADIVRAPEPGEARDPDWLPLHRWIPRQKARVLEAIELGFGHLRRGDGMRIYDAELADSYGRESEISRRVARVFYQRYDEVPDAIVADYHWVLSFFDPPSLRFHFAAYMSWAVRDGQGDSDLFLIFALTPSTGELRRWSLDRLELLDAAQARAVVLFLELFAVHPFLGDEARKALAWWKPRAEALPG